LYDALVEAYRDAPGNARHAAKVAGCDRATARRAWEKGFGAAMPAISATFEAERATGKRTKIAVAFLVIVAAGAAWGLSRRTSPPPKATSTAPLTAPEPFDVTTPERFPTDREPERFAGAEACRRCHADAYAAWRASPHGRAMAAPSDQSVLGRFDGQPVAVPDGTAAPSIVDGRWSMELRGPGGTERHDVTLVLAAGRQHQSYFTKTDDGSLKTLPVFWSTREDTWVPTDIVRQNSLDETKRGLHWKSSLDEVSMGCMSCHLSGVEYRVDHGKVDIRWRDLAVDCESCHGPGREHVEHHDSGRPADDDPYGDLHALAKEDEVALCGECHAFKARFRHRRDGAERPDFAYMTLASHELRSNATQLATGYQTAGHLVSPCYLDGAMACSSCHAPHDQTPRALDGTSARGAESNQQCTVCHRDLIEHSAFVGHTKHLPNVRCIDCHMPLHWIKDTASSHQRVSDHSVSIPRPSEPNPNACNECHADRDAAWAQESVEAWGYEKAATPRPWIAAIGAGRKKEAGASTALLSQIDQFGGAPYMLASLLELLSQQKPVRGAAAKLRELIAHDDHLVRAWAYRALMTHDPSFAGRWLNEGSSDAHPIVRMLVFQGFGDEQRFSEKVLSRHLQDVLLYSERPPINELRYLTMIRMRRKEWDAALTTLDLADRYATAHDARDFELPSAREIIERARRQTRPQR